MGRRPSNILRLSSRFGLGALFSFIFACSIEAQTGRPYLFGFNDDPTPIRIGLKDGDDTIYFKMPKNLLTFSNNWNGGVQDFLVIEVTYPSMSPLSVNGRDENRPDVLIVHLNSYAHTGAQYKTQKTIDRAISERWTPTGEIRDNAGQLYQHYLERPAKSAAGDNPFLKEFFIPSSRAVYIECFQGKKLPNAGCRAVTDYGKSLSLTIQFRRSQFEHWPEFYGAVVRLLDSQRQAITE